MKNAKKSMFITTILMVAVLIVAVSTATFAWYTATTSISATTAVVSSASSTSADIGIDWTANLATTSTSITLDSESKVLPMVPTAAITEGATAITFNSAPINLDGKFTGSVTNPAPWTIKHVEGEEPDQTTYTSFHVINKNYNEAVTVKMTVTDLAGDLADNLCIAVFAGTQVIGVFANQDYNVGTITIGNESTALGTCDYRVAATTGSITLPEIAARQSVQISVYAWINGGELTSFYANKDVASFSFAFAPANA